MSTPLSFTFMILEDHPYGREMLRCLLQHQLMPQVIIQEVSKVAVTERDKFVERVAGQVLPPSLSELVCGKNIPIYNVANHNDQASKDILQAYHPEVLVLGGTRIIKSDILKIPTRGTINAHPGLLPILRGSSSPAWALYKNIPQGSTVHYIDPNIDTGDIIIQRKLPVYHTDSYESINYRIAQLSGELMAEALELITNNQAPRLPQDTNEAIGETLKVIPENLLLEAKTRLASGQYSHYAD